MGYEIKLIIGCKGTTSKKIERSSAGEIDGNCVYFPYIRDGEGSFKYTDVDETYFMVYAEIDLCKLGHDSHLGKILTANKDSKKEIYYYGTGGNVAITEDCYGDKPNEASVGDCVEALKLDIANSNYRRFKWALALLESMQDEEDISVIWYGH